MKGKTPSVLAGELEKKYFDQAYHQALKLHRMAEALGDFDSAQLYLQASIELRKTGYDRFQEQECMRIPVVTAAGAVIMMRETFDLIIRELERAGVNLSIEKASPAEQRTFDDALTVATLEGAAGSRIVELLDCLPDDPERFGSDEEGIHSPPRPDWIGPARITLASPEEGEADELTKLEQRVRGDSHL